jgi:8-oxo-dGTP pyrophosphatase MutT (NUDIX family)
MPHWCRDVVLLDHDAPIPTDRPFTSAQAHAAGVPAPLLSDLVGRGLLRPLVRGVHVAVQVPDSLSLRVAAAALVVPPHVVAVDRTAAWVHGVDALPRSAIHLMPSLDLFSTRGSRMRRSGISSGTRTLLTRDVEQLGPLRVTTPLRTACDLGRLLWRYDALAAIDGFLRIGVDPGELTHEIGRFKGHRGVRQLRFLAPLGDDGAESPPESALRLHWYEAGIPARPQTQIWEHDDAGVPVFRIDVGDQEVRYGAEFFGESFHGPDAEEHDEERLAWLSDERRWVMDVFTKVDVYGNELAARDRLSRGFEEARTSLGTRATRYIDLSRRAS